MPQQTHPRLLWLLAAFVAATAVPLPFLAASPFAFVELLTVDAIRLPVSGLVEHRLQGAHTPTWYLLLKALGLAHADPWLLRLPSALAQGLAVVLAGIIGGRLGGRAGFLLGALLVALQPVLLEFADYARPYAALVAATLWMLLSSAALAERPRLAVAALSSRLSKPLRSWLRWRWLSAMAAPVVAASFLPLGLLVWLVLDLALAGWLAWRPGQGRAARRRLLRCFLLWRLLPLGLTLLGYLALWSTFERLAGVYWPRELALDSALPVLEAALGWQPLLDRDLFLPGVGNLLLGLLVGALALAGLLTRPRRIATVLAAALALGLPLLLLAISLHTSLLVPRYAGPACAGLALLAAKGAARLLRFWPPAGWAVTLPLVALLSLQALDALSGDRQRVDLVPVAAWLAEAHPEPGEEWILSNLTAADYALNHYLGDIGAKVSAVEVDLETARLLLGKRQRIWLLLLYEGKSAGLLEALGQELVTCERRWPLVRLVGVAALPSALPSACVRS